MATKLQLITELAKQTSKELSSADKWMAFLNSASWQYKYSFEDQVLIFAQRPDAKACADFDTWNEKLNRRINKGAKGIALLRERGNGFYLDHVFDVSDTNRGNRGLDIKLWEYNERFDDAIIETLENTFGELKVTTSNDNSSDSKAIPTDIEKLNVRTFNNSTSGVLNDKCQDIEKVNTNETDSNNPNKNNTDFNETESKKYKAEQKNSSFVNSS